MPNRSGGAVVISSRRLIGVHVSSCWHRDRPSGTGRSEGGSSTSEAVSSTSSEPPDILEVDALNMWREPDDGQLEAETSDHVAAQESYANIPVSVAWGSTAVRDHYDYVHAFSDLDEIPSSLLASLFPFCLLYGTAQIPAGHIRHCSGTGFHPEEPKAAPSRPPS